MSSADQVTVRFRNPEGQIVERRSDIGANLLRVAQAAGLPLEGTCEGQMACSTCHVIVASDWFDKLPEASEDEEDMLDLAASVARTSRLSCQIELTPELDGLEVTVPPDSHDMSRG